MTKHCVLTKIEKTSTRTYPPKQLPTSARSQVTRDFNCHPASCYQHCLFPSTPVSINLQTSMRSRSHLYPRSAAHARDCIASRSPECEEKMGQWLHLLRGSINSLSSSQAIPLWFSFLESNYQSNKISINLLFTALPETKPRSSRQKLNPRKKQKSS